MPFISAWLPLRGGRRHAVAVTALRAGSIVTLPPHWLLLVTPPAIHPLGNQPLGGGRGHLFTFLAFSPFSLSLSLSTEKSEGLLFARMVTTTLPLPPTRSSFFWACTVQHGSPQRLWLLDFKFIKDENIKNPVAWFPEPHCQESTATHGQWLPRWTAFITMESPIGRHWSRRRYSSRKSNSRRQHMLNAT